MMKQTLFNRTTLLILVGVLFLAAGCGSRSNITVITKTLKRSAAVSYAAPQELETSGTSNSGNEFWIEGTVQNAGTSDARQVRLTFRCKEGKVTRVFTAMLPILPAGKTMEFKTQIIESHMEMRLSDEEPEIAAQ